MTFELNKFDIPLWTSARTSTNSRSKRVTVNIVVGVCIFISISQQWLIVRQWNRSLIWIGQLWIAHHSIRITTIAVLALFYFTKKNKINNTSFLYLSYAFELKTKNIYIKLLLLPVQQQQEQLER